MNYFDAVVLGIVEGLTEFLPISSTGHLTIAAVVVYFFRDIARIARAWVAGLVKPEYRGTLDHRMGWYVIVGTIPVGIAGLVFKDVITGPLRSLWVVAFALIAWSAVMWAAERVGRQDRSEKDLRLRDAVGIGLIQVVALVPGVSRSGATISGGLFLGLDRVTATRVSFFLSIPALVAAGLFELPDAMGGDIALGVALVGIAVAFVVAYASIAWLLRFVAGHAITWFIPYRVALGLLLIGLLAAGVMAPT